METLSLDSLFDFIHSPPVLIVIVVLGLAYEGWRDYKCRGIIGDHIIKKNGKIGAIERLTAREELYHVTFTIAGEKNSKTVKFNFFYKNEWY